jgi:hypothetical protein
VSVLALPRIYLRTSVSWDPAVSNNDGANQWYDPHAVKAQLREGETVDAFRARMIAATAQRGDWNYYGSFAAVLDRARVTGVQLNADGLGDDTGLHHAPVGLIGKLVDVDPRGTVSQWFFDELTVGSAGAPLLRARPVRRMVSRWINFGRNLQPLAVAGAASASWQAVFAKGDLELFRAEESPTLAALERALREPGVRGLMLRLETYRTEYFQNGRRNRYPAAAGSRDLAEHHAAGRPVPNPAYSHCVGVLGLWHDGDAPAVASGRVLVPVGDAPVLQLPGQRSAPWVARAEGDGTRVALDFGSTFSELDQDLEKVDLGPLTLLQRGAGGAEILAVVSAAAYASSHYEARAGIVDLTTETPLDPTATLELHAGERATDSPILVEARGQAVCDVGTLYLDVGGTADLTVRAFDGGRPAAAGSWVDLAWYDEDFAFNGEVQSVAVDAQGRAVVAVGPFDPGFRYVALLTRGAADPVPALPDGLDTALQSFVGIRVLPADQHLAALNENEISFEQLYENVLKVYDAITPRMSEVLRLNDERAMKHFAARILEVTDPLIFESARYMPVTRNLSAQRRRLLRGWCRRVLGQEGADMAPTAAEAARAAARMALHADPSVAAPPKPDAAQPHLQKRLLPP